MASRIKNSKEGFSYIECPFKDITGCEIMLIINGYCSAGKYCIKDCEYAWSIMEDV